MFVESVALLSVLTFIVSRVLRQDKWLGSLIQLGDVQNRERVHQTIVQEREQQSKGILSRIPSITPSERVAFTLGILNIALRCLISMELLIVSCFDACWLV